MPKQKSGEISKSRLLKAICEQDNYIIRVSRTTIMINGLPICPVCNNKFKEVK